MDLVIALVDYDNVRRAPERQIGDVDMNVASIVNALVVEAQQFLRRPRELLIRLYGGWIDEYGHHSLRAQWLLCRLPWYRGRHRGMIVKLSLATSLACDVSQTLTGTVRQTPSGSRQKMIDTMLAVDVLYFTRDCRVPIILFSDDDDLVPAAIAARALATGAPMHWLRCHGLRLNDTLLSRRGITFGTLEALGHGLQ